MTDAKNSALVQSLEITVHVIMDRCNVASPMTVATNVWDGNTLDYDVNSSAVEIQLSLHERGNCLSC